MLNNMLAKVEKLINRIIPQKTAVAGCTECRPDCTRECCDYHAVWYPSPPRWVYFWICNTEPCQPC